MNKMWLAVLLVPYVGYAQEIDEFKENLVSDHEEAVAVEQISEEVYQEKIAVNEKDSPILSKKVKKQYEKEPCFCAYCGSALVAQSEKSPQQEDSKELAQAKETPSPIKKQVTQKSQMGSSKIHEHSNRPRVTQRKSALVETESQNGSKSTNSQQIVEEGKNNVGEFESIDPSHTTKSNKSVSLKGQSPLLGAETPSTSKKNEQSSLATEPKKLSRPKVTQRKQVSVVEESLVEENPVQETKVDQKPRSKRFAAREQTVVKTEAKKSSVVQKRPCSKGKKTLQKEKVVAKKSSQGSKARIKESMYTYSPQDED